MKSLITLAAVLVAAFLGISMMAPPNKDYLPPKEEQITHMDECPKASGEVHFLDGDGKTYIHCKVCGIGALIEHDDGVLRCTHCGRR